MNGVINLDKPAGISSARAVARVKRLLPRGTKIGHAGTLDPFATGVLLLLIGKATKQCERLMSEPKQYETIVKLGAITATLDPQSPEERFTSLSAPRAPSSPAHGPGDVSGVPTRQVIETMLARFAGEIQQRPPAYSAMKIDGQRAYKLARAGEPVELPPRTVHVHGIELLDFAWPLMTLRIDCGRGTYIRAIARDLGEALGVGGYLTSLRRTRVGVFTAGDAVMIERLEAESVEPYLHEI